MEVGQVPASASARAPKAITPVIGEEVCRELFQLRGIPWIFCGVSEVLQGWVDGRPVWAAAC